MKGVKTGTHAMGTAKADATAKHVPMHAQKAAMTTGVPALRAATKTVTHAVAVAVAVDAVDATKAQPAPSVSALTVKVALQKA